MALRKTDELADYVGVLEDDPAETAALYQDFLIRVTAFFRDPESFEGLRAHVLPSLCESRSAKDRVRVWVPGCATGEEVFSIAITLAEYLGERFSASGIQIFGTDVSEAAIEKARAGFYLDTITEQVSAERLARFFTKEDHHYRIAKSLRDACIFARQDVTRDPPFSRLDLVSCRNLLIYLDAAAQRRVMQVFHYSLRAQGILMLGPSESVGASSELFELIDKSHRYYARRPTPATTVLDAAPPAIAPYTRARDAFDKDAALSEAESAPREADRLLLTEYAPASLLVDDALTILQIRGETGPYLELASGAPSLNLNRVARPELLIEIAPALAEARESGSRVRREGLRVDDLTDITVQVIPLKRPQPCFLIVFEDSSRGPSARRAQHPAAVLSESEKDRRLAQAEREIGATREYLQATMEEHEAVKEELKSAHEEVLSANEEFQSTNEELETAKEELQSTNEELTTTNDELRNRNRELSVLNSDLEKTRQLAEHARAYADAIVETVREPLVVLDVNLMILRANQAFYTDFKARRDETEGRSLKDIDASQWNHVALLEQLAAVVKRDLALDNYEFGYIVEGNAPRVLRVNGRKIPGDDERAELVLLAIDDVTERTAARERLRSANQRKDEFLAMLAHELRNPLTPISHAMSLLRRGEGRDDPSKLYELIERQTKRLVRLVDDLLDVARISRGHIELKRDVVELRELVQQAAEASGARIEERRHELAVVLPKEPVCVVGDAVRLEQLVSNLLENAAKYTPPGGRIEVELTEERGEAWLRVADNGIGLAADRLENIFDLFAQVDRSLARSGGGLGIGLTLVRRVLDLHGGRVEARSAGLGQGSEFIVRLPAVPSLKKEDNASRSQASFAPPLARRVLVVEDNADAAESLAMLARSWGHEVAVAADGPAALELAHEFRPQHALVDIGLPGMNGYELARRLRATEAHRDLYLIAMTGYGRAEDRAAALAAGFDLHLVKPADLDELQYVLGNGARFNRE